MNTHAVRRRVRPVALLAAGLAGCRPPADAPQPHAVTAQGFDVPQLVLTRFTVLVTDAQTGVTPGFDVDDRVTALGDAGCESVRPDGTDGAGAPGIDNQLGAIMDLVGGLGATAQLSLDQAVVEGGLLYMLQVDAAGSAPALSVARVGPAPGVSVSGDVLQDQTFWLYDEDARVADAVPADLVDGLLSAGPWDMPFPIDVLGTWTTFGITHARLELRASDDGVHVEGTWGGAIDVDSIRALYLNRPDLGDAETRQLGDVLLPSLADVDADGDGACESVSFAFAVQGVRAFLAE